MAASPRCGSTVAQCVGVHVHVVVDEAGEPVRSPAWLQKQLSIANDRFAPANVGFELAKVDALPATSGPVVSRKDRDALGRGRYTSSDIHLFLVESLADVDQPGHIRGVHWRDRGDRKRRWIILSSIAAPFVLAHELGHYFGLPHTKAADSIMNKSPGLPTPMSERGFPKAELATIRTTARRIVPSPLRHRKP